MSARFLSIISLPLGASPSDLRGAVPILALVLGDDIERWRPRLKLIPPAILGPFDAETALAACEALIAAGGDAFAPSMAEIESLGATHKFKTLEVAPGAECASLRGSLWRGGEAVIPCSEITALIRATINSRTSKDYRIEGGPSPVSVAMLPIEATIAHLAIDPPRAVPVYDTRGSHKIDLHTREGRVFQIDGDKFRFDILGDARARSDLANTNAALELLRHLMPHAAVDEYFNSFKPPAMFDRMRIPQATINNDDPAFAFYSRWAALMYRHVLT